MKQECKFATNFCINVASILQNCSISCTLCQRFRYSWVRGRDVDQETLHRALRHLQMERVITLRGYVSVQRF